MDGEERSASAEEIVRLLADRFCIFAQDDRVYTAEELSRYGLPSEKEFDRQDLLDVTGLRYALSLQSYQKYLSVTAARDVSEETAAAVMENGDNLPGVGIREDSIRVYHGGEACAPVLGYTGRISVEELEEKENEGLTAESVVGKTGMEQYLDETLQGKNGKKEVLVDNMGRVTEDLGVTEEAAAGKDVYLTIDLELQKKAYEILERKIADILLENLINEKTFDRTAVGDAAEIKIPVYDVYTALVTNRLIDVSRLRSEDASETERRVHDVFEQGKETVLREIETMLADDQLKYSSLTKEMQEYADFIVAELGVIDRKQAEEDSEIYEELETQWNGGNLSVREYLYQAIEQGWISADASETEAGYLTQEELCGQVSEHILSELSGSDEFEEKIWKRLILNDEVLPEQLCMILYDQEVFDRQDQDYSDWQQGVISTYELVVRKMERLEIRPSDLALDPCSGSAVVTDPDTGDVLACVSYPGYDSNRLANQMDNDYYYRIYNNDSLPLYNRATQQLSAPGSTFKPVTVIAGLEEGVIDSGTGVTCDGVFDKVAPPLKCWNTAGHGAVGSAAEALQNSCNDYLCEISYRLGMTGNAEFSDEQALECIQDYAELFDLDKKSGIEIDESSPQITDRYAIPSAIGQGTNHFSTVQMARYAATLANRGTSFRLTLIDSIDGVKKESETESVIETSEISEESWDVVHTGMMRYAQSTGAFEGFPVSAAGKSGTAQEIKTRPDHALFVGFAPAEKPEAAIAVRIVNGYEAGYSVECAREILETVMEINGIA